MYRQWHWRLHSRWDWLLMIEVLADTKRYQMVLNLSWRRALRSLDARTGVIGKAVESAGLSQPLLSHGRFNHLLGNTQRFKLGVVKGEVWQLVFWRSNSSTQNWFVFLIGKWRHPRRWGIFLIGVICYAGSQTFLNQQLKRKTISSLMTDPAINNSLSFEISRC